MSFDLRKPIRGRVWKLGDSIDTDAVNPYYRYADYEELKKHALESYRPEFGSEVKPGDIVVSGRNFGCGSARPVTILYDVGVAAVVAESLSRLALRNCISLAQPVFIAPGVTDIVADGQTLEIDYQAGMVRNPATGAQAALRKYPPMIEHIFAAGGILQYAHQRYTSEEGGNGR